jgi:hypothetical protein
LNDPVARLCRVQFVETRCDYAHVRFVQRNCRCPYGRCSMVRSPFWISLAFRIPARTGCRSAARAHDMAKCTRTERRAGQPRGVQ